MKYSLILFIIFFLDFLWSIFEVKFYVFAHIFSFLSH